MSGHRYSVALDVAVAALPDTFVELLRDKPEPMPERAAWQHGSGELRNQSERIIAYCRSKAEADQSVSGSNGSAALARWCGVIFWKFGLSESEGWPLLVEMNRCASPPWSESELRHAMRSGMAAHPSRPEPRGSLLRVWSEQDEQGKHMTQRPEPVRLHAVATGPAGPAFAVSTVEQVFAPLGAIPWAIEGFSLAPGAPGMLAGYGGRGKSWLAQALAISVASGIALGPGAEVKKGRVVYLDYEQASREAFSRFQRISRALDVTPSALADRFAAVISPRCRLSDTRAETELITLCVGATLCIIDSLSACVIGVDENSSAMREPLDMLTRVSERTGCSFLVLHHARKPPVNQEKGYDKEMSIRGSSGIHAACSTIWQIDGPPGGASIVEHVKSRSSKLRDSFELKITDVRFDPRDPSSGGVLVSLESQARPVPGAQTGSTSYEKLSALIMQFVHDNPGCSQANLRSRIQAKANRIGDTTHALIEQGKLVNMGGSKSGAAMALHVVTEASRPSEQF